MADVAADGVFGRDRAGHAPLRCRREPPAQAKRLGACRVSGRDHRWMMRTIRARSCRLPLALRGKHRAKAPSSLLESQAISHWLSGASLAAGFGLSEHQHIRLLRKQMVSAAVTAGLTLHRRCNFRSEYRRPGDPSAFSRFVPFSPNR